MPRQLGDTGQANPNGFLLGYGDAVTPLAWNDPHVGQVGTVRRTVLRGGDIEVTVQFADGTRRDYWEDELRRI